MSIANKLTYLEETKGLIKEKMNDLGAELTESNTFREYAEKLEEIYRNYPKTIIRGSDITLPIAKKEKIEIFPIGNTTQNEGASPDNPQPIKNVTGNNTVKIGGKNILNVKSENITQSNWLDYNENMQTFTIKQGVGRAPVPIPIDIDLVVGDTITVSVICESGQYSGTGTNISIGTYHNGDSTSWQGQVSLPRGEDLKDRIFSSTHIITAEINSLMPFIYGNPTIDKDIVFKVQVEKNSTATPYEPYIEPIEKELNLKSKNLAPINLINNVNWGENSNLINMLNNLTEGTYTFSAKYTLLSKSNDFLDTDVYGIYLSNPAGYNYIYKNNQWGNETEKTLIITFTLTSNYVGKFTAFSFYGCGRDGLGKTGEVNITEIQIEEGPTATEYEPYYNYELAHTYTATQDWYDYIEGSKDNWKLIKQNKRLKITGSSGFGYYTDAGTDSRLYRARHLIPDTVGPTSFGYHYTDLVKCDKFGTTKSNADITTKDIMQVAQNDGRIALFTYITKERLGITDSDTAAEKQQKYKDWFTQNQPEVIYPSTGVEEITITQPALINQLNELYSMMTTGKTITIKTESEEENAQLNLEIRTL